MTTELQPTASLLGSRPLDDDFNSNELYLGLTLETWIKVGILGSLFMATYWLVLRWLWDKTNPICGEANWGHAICIPVVGLYYLYINRDELFKAHVKPTWAGLGITLLGLVTFAYGIWPGQNQFTQGFAMIMALFGIVLLLCGWQIMKVAWFPIVYLICGIPWPPLVYSWIASPLQTLAAKVAVKTLQFTGVTAYRTGTKINIGDILAGPVRTLNVAEACAGLRSLMTFITVGAAVAFLSQRPLWQKIIITLSAIPIAIFCNVMRVAGQGLLDHYVSRQLSESFAHQFVGLIMLIPAFFLILLVGYVLDHIFIEEVDVKPARAKVSPATGIVARPSMYTPPVAPRTPAASAAPRANPAAARPAAATPVAAPVKPAAPAIPRPAARPAPAPAAAKPATPPRPGIVPSALTPPRPAGAAVGPKPKQPAPPAAAGQQPRPKEGK